MFNFHVTGIHSPHLPRVNNTRVLRANQKPRWDEIDITKIQREPEPIPVERERPKSVPPPSSISDNAFNSPKKQGGLLWDLLIPSKPKKQN